MSKVKYYAVKKGRNPGIYTTWEECSKEVIGYQNAIYKSFKTIEEANEYLNSENQGSSFIKKEKKKTNDNAVLKANQLIEKQISNLEIDEAISFVDGTYLENELGIKKVGYGVVLITSKTKKYLSQQLFNVDYIQYRNVYGEIEAAMAAINWAINNNIKKLAIYYDYEGINAWATKKWSANNDLTKDYVKFIDSISNQIKLLFLKVKSHTGIIYNELADELASKSVL